MACRCRQVGYVATAVGALALLAASSAACFGLLMLLVFGLSFHLALLDEEEVALGEEMLGSGSSSFAGAATEVRAEPYRQLNLC